MKKHTSQVFVALVCAFLGFLLAYQFKVLTKSNSEEKSINNSELASELESLKKENEELTKNNKSLNENLKNLEDNAKDNGSVSKEITTQLETSRMQLGTDDVKGQGVIVTITPKSSVFGNNTSDTKNNLNDEELIHLTNILWFAKAEAISINGYRITSQTGIKNSGNYIWVGSSDKVNPQEKIVIKAIGDKTKLSVGLTFQDASKYRNLSSYDISITQSDDMVIEKTTQSLKNDYINPVK